MSEIKNKHLFRFYFHS